jgi:hypothetical protein
MTGRCFLLLLAACTSIDDPARFEKSEAGTAEPQRDAGAYARCRQLDRHFATNVRARIYGDPPGPQAVCVTLELPIPAAQPGAVTFCVAGSLATVAVPSVHSVVGNLQTCAYCIEVQTNCSDGDAGRSCLNSYAPLTGSARVVHLGRAPRETVWIDVGDLEVARVAGSSGELEPRDCLFTDALTLQGTLEHASPSACAAIDRTACSIATTAGSRTP